MSRGAVDLPEDPAELRRFASELQRSLVALEAEIQAKSLLVEKLKFQLAVCGAHALDVRRRSSTRRSSSSNC